MAPISLADVSITSATPGVLVKGTVDPRLATNDLVVSLGTEAVRAITDQIDSSYIVGGDTAYIGFVILRNDGTFFHSISFCFE